MLIRHRINGSPGRLYKGFGKKKKLFQDNINEHSPLLDSTHREEHEYSVNSILSEGTSKTLWLS